MPRSTRLRSRADVESTLAGISGIANEWTLENFHHDKDDAGPRCLASHREYGQVAALTGPELVGAVETVEDVARRLRLVGRELKRGNLDSPTSAWWDGEVLSPRSAWANDLLDLQSIVQRREEARQAPDAAPTPTAPQRPDVEPSHEPDILDGLDVDAFARRVLEVARTVPADGWFGTDKVFISRVWEALEPEWRTGRQVFNQALLEANRTQRLTLTRADLVSAMDPDTVAASEVQTYGARFHFVVVEGGPHA